MVVSPSIKQTRAGCQVKVQDKSIFQHVHKIPQIGASQLRSEYDLLILLFHIIFLFLPIELYLYQIWPDLE